MSSEGSFFQDKKKVALLAAGVAAAGVGVLAYKKFGSQATATNKGGAASSVSRGLADEWSVAEVEAWLKSINVTPTTIRRFLENDVDGAVLVNLEESHLKEMGVTSAGDRIKIVSGLKKAVPHSAMASPTRGGATGLDGDEAHPPVAARGGDESADAAFDRGEAAAERAHKAAAIQMEQQTVEVATAIIGSLKNMFSVLGSEEFLQARPQEQLSVLATAEEQLNKILPVAEQLPTREKDQIVPACASLATMITRVRDSLKNQQEVEGDDAAAGVRPPSTQSREAAVGEGEQEDMQRWTLMGDDIMGSLRELRKLIHSPEAAATSPRERAEILQSVISQISKILEFSKSFPPKIQDSLAVAAQQLLKEAQQNLDPNAPATTTTTGTDAADAARSPTKGASAQHITTRLRSVFGTLRSDAVLKAPPAEQAAFFEKSLQECIGLRNEAQRLEKPDEREVVMEIATNIVQALEQTKKLCEAKLEQEKRTPILPLPELVAELRTMMAVTRSDEFLKTPAKDRGTIISEMEVRLTALEPSLRALPQDEIEGLQPAFEKLRSFIGKLTEENDLLISRAERADEKESTEKDNDVLAQVIEALKEMYSLLSSEAFRAQGVESRAEMASSLNGRLQEIKSTVATLSPEHRASVGELLTSLENMLNSLVQAAAVTKEAATAAGRPPVDEKEEEEDLNAEEESALTDADKKAVSVVNRVQQLFGVINSEQFTEATPEKRRALAEAVLRHLHPLARDVSTLGEEHRNQLQPVVESLQKTLNQFVSDSSAVEDNIYNLASGATQRMLDGDVKTMEDLKEIMDILEKLDASPPTSEEQLKIRKEFQQTLSLTLDRIQQFGGQPGQEGDEKKEEEGEADEDEEKKYNELPEAHQKFRSALVAIQHQLDTQEITSVEELTPFTTILEEMLSAAEQDQIDWRSDKQSVAMVKKILDTIQKLQESITVSATAGDDDGGENDGDAAATSVVRTINQATRTLQDSRKKMVGIHELSPYLELLDALSQMQDSLGLEELKAQQALQQLVIEISEEMKNDLGGDQPPALDGEENAEEDGTQEESSDEQDATIVAMLRQLAAKIAAHEPSKASDLGPYIQMVESFRKKPHKSETVLKALEEVENIIKAKLEEIGKTPEDCKEELIENKRQSLKKLREVITHDLFTRLPQEQQISAIGKASQALESVTPEEGEHLQEEITALMDALEAVNPADDEVVNGSLASELSLIPRILDRLKMEDFLEQTTAFEVRQIANMFERLTGNREIASNAEHGAVLNLSKELFNTRISGFGEAPCKDPIESQNPLEARKMVSESEDGTSVVRYLLVGPEEVEYEKSEEVKEQFTSTPKKRTADSVTKEVSGSWNDRSEALILVMPSSNPDANTTTISEVASLADHLSTIHGFNVNCFQGNNLNDKEFTNAVEEICAEKPARFMIYVHSANAYDPRNLPHCINFPDGTSVSYTAALKQCAGSVDHTVLFHDSGRAFDVAAMKGGHSSPFVGLGITEGGFAISNVSRCWLYDGLFTPLFLELVAAPAQLAICPEDAVNHCIRQLTGTRSGLKGSFVDDSAISAPFLMDTSAESEEEN